MRGGLYSPDEMAKCDKIINCYVGKIYEGQRASEIYSMGLQELYDNAVGFARKDPDHFDFIVDSLIWRWLTTQC